MNACWGLSRGLLSGLISTTGVHEAPAGGWSPAAALALFTTLWVSVSLSMRRRKQVKKSDAVQKNGGDGGQTLTHPPPPLPLPSFFSLG